jgi:bacteriocin-like protein
MQNENETEKTLETLTAEQLAQVVGGRRGRGAGRSSN